MNRNFTTYHAEKKDKKVIVSTYNGDEIVEVLTFGIIPTEELERLIVEKNELFLEKIFIENFDFKSILRHNVSLRIKECFLVYDEIFDLSEQIFKELDFSYSIINAGQIDFSKIKTGKANFSYTFFNAERVTFESSEFSDEGVSFKNSKFSDGIKNFEKILFSGKDVNFGLVEFGNGNVIFQDSHFGKCRVNFMMASFGEGRKDFVRCQFEEGEKIFERVHFGEGNISFRGADFGKGSVNFRRCEFGKGEKSFISTNFGEGNVRFTSSNFGDGKVIFRLAEFDNGIKDFHYSVFGNTDLIFDRTVFKNGDIDFKAVDFGAGRILFNRIEKQSGNFIFEGIEKTEGSITFKNSYLGIGKFIFDTAKCKQTVFSAEDVNFGVGKLSFKKVDFHTISFKNCQFNNYFDLRVRNCKNLIVSECVVKEVLDLSAFDYVPKIENLDFSGLRLLGRIFIEWYPMNLKEKILKQKNPIEAKAEQFRMLKENFRNNGQYDEEDLAYVEFKRMEAKSKLLKKIHKNPKGKIFHYLTFYSNKLIMDKLGAYATNPIRVLIGMAIVYLFFSVLYLFIEIIFPANGNIVSSLFPEGDPQVLGKVAKAFYHSAITFLTIGYGDYYPEGINRWISALEGFIGLFMMSYFTVAFVRKILR